MFVLYYNSIVGDNMKLVADVDTIKSNLDPLTSEISNFRRSKWNIR